LHRHAGGGNVGVVNACGEPPLSDRIVRGTERALASAHKSVSPSLAIGGEEECLTMLTTFDAFARQALGW
jgi:hypothetical protein